MHPVSTQNPPLAGDRRNVLPLDEWKMLMEARHFNPHSILGPHDLGESAPGKRRCVVRAFDPFAAQAQLSLDQGHNWIPMHSWGEGCFEHTFEKEVLPKGQHYRLKFYGYLGDVWETEDPYAFAPTLDDRDLHAFGEGNCIRLYDVLGAHPCTVDGVTGTRFAVWAPHAERVSVLGNFNAWDNRRHPMRTMGACGVWELFIPRVVPGSLYKLEIRTRGGQLLEKTDPFGRGFELRPSNAAVVTELAGYAWNDHDWMTARAQRQPARAPLNIYEVHLGSWMRDPSREHGFLSYEELAHRLAAYCREMSYTHVELMPVAEHPYDGSWGYQVTGYFAPTRRYGTPKEFMAFVDILHQAGLGVIADWVPAHFPRDAWALGRFDGTALYEHEDPRQGEHRDWGTFIFNYGRNEVRNFLVSNALFWLDYYHLDGLRVDAVASMLYLDYSRQPGEWIPNRYGGRENLEALEFIKHTNHLVHELHPGVITLAEESTSWPAVTRPVYTGGLGFDFKWNMGWMNDFLQYMALDPIHRKFHHGKLTFAMMYAYSEQFVLVLSHDEVVHGKRSLLAKMPGDEWQKFANLRVALTYMMAHPGKKLLFMGGELGQWQEWHEAQALGWNLLDWPLHAQLHRLVRELNQLYLQHPCMYQIDASWEGFSWIDCHDAENSVVSFVRQGERPEDKLVFVFNFTPVVRQSYVVGVPYEGYYAELLNTDAGCFGGSNQGNMGGVWTQGTPSHGQPCSISLTLPPLAGLVFKPDPSSWNAVARDAAVAIQANPEPGVSQPAPPSGEGAGLDSITPPSRKRASQRNSTEASTKTLKTSKPTNPAAPTRRPSKASSDPSSTQDGDQGKGGARKKRRSE